MQAAREASRPGNHEVHEVRIEALGHRVETLESRVSRIDAGQTRVETAIDGLVTEVGEWKLKAVDSETVKVREEQKTKRWMAIVGLLTMLVAPLLTVAVNQITKDDPSPQTQVLKSAMEIETEACAKLPMGPDYVACISEAAARHAPTPKR